MKILVVGKLPAEHQYKITCHNCGTVFEFLRKEAEYVTEQRDGDYLIVTCPLEGCGKQLSALCKT